MRPAFAMLTSAPKLLTRLLGPTPAGRTAIRFSRAS